MKRSFYLVFFFTHTTHPRFQPMPNYILFFLLPLLVQSFTLLRIPSISSQSPPNHLFATPTSSFPPPPPPSLSTVGFILLAGGTGSRMKADRPKQFLTLAGKTVLEHSLTLLLSTLPTDFNNPPAKVVLVMNEEYRGEFEHLVGGSGGRLIFADPGIERQGSVENGLNKVSENGDGEGGKASSRDETDRLPPPPSHVVEGKLPVLYLLRRPRFSAPLGDP